MNLIRLLLYKILARDSAIVRRALQNMIVNRQRLLARECRARFGSTVQTGPFSGMLLPSERSSGGWLPMFLGAFEAELHPWLERIRQSAYKQVVNVGCAEGYYAIGIARLLPGARVLAFDTDPKARAICESAAAQNGVACRIVVQGTCKAEDLQRILSSQEKTLLVLDCEGTELDLLQLELVPGLQCSDIWVECHDFVRPNATAILKSRFAITHLIEEVAEGARDPGMYPPLRNMKSIDRMISLCEIRDERSNWLFLTSKPQAAQ
jgi:hypothetical protein